MWEILSVGWGIAAVIAGTSLCLDGTVMRREKAGIFTPIFIICLFTVHVNSSTVQL